MSLRSYSSNAFERAEGFRATLSSRDVAALRKDILQLGEEGWFVWVAENHAATFSLLSLSPAKLEKRSEWQDPILRRRFAFAAYRAARLGGLTLALSDELQPGGEWGETCESAARKGHEFLLDSRWFWPFGGQPPFPGWEPPEDLDYSISYSHSFRDQLS